MKKVLVLALIFALFGCQTANALDEVSEEISEFYTVRKEETNITLFRDYGSFTSTFVIFPKDGTFSYSNDYGNYFDKLMMDSAGDVLDYTYSDYDNGLYCVYYQGEPSATTNKTLCDVQFENIETKKELALGELEICDLDITTLFEWANYYLEKE